MIEVFEEDLAGRAKRIQTLLEDAKEAFIAVQTALADLLAEAGTSLGPEGGIGEERFKVLVAFASEHHQGVEVTDEQRALFDRAETLSIEFKELLAEARRIDDDLAAELEKIDDSAPAMPPVVGEPGFADRNGQYLREKHQEFLDMVENGEVNPAVISNWWNMLSEEEQALFVATAPDLIGPLDGIDTEDRDTANRDLLEEEITDLDAQIARMEAELENTPRDQRYNDLEAEIEALQEQRDGLNNLNEQIAEPYTAVDPYGEPVSAEHYLLGYDSAGDGQAIVAVGNPDTADNVNVYVPGTKADMEGLNGELARAEGTFADAAKWGPDGSTTASIMWLGYDAPDEVQPYNDSDNEGWEPGASSEKYAENAASDLSSFVDGLRATDQGSQANLTMTGHSYGSTTIGVAAREEGLDVDNMVFVGSPGVGVDHADELGINSENVWSSRNEADVIQYGLVHGEDTTSEEFGGNTFSSATARGIDDSTWGAMTGQAAVDYMLDSHGAYYEEGNPARYNMALIITGQSEEIKQ